MRWQLQARPSLGIRTLTQLPAYSSGVSTALELEDQVAPLFRNAFDEALKRVSELIDDEFLRRRLEKSMPKRIRKRYSEGEVQVVDIRGKQAMTVVFPGVFKAVHIEYEIDSWDKHG